MTAGNDVQKFEELNKQLAALGSKIQTLKGQEKEKTARLTAIFTKHAVTSMGEFRTQFDSLKKALDESAIAVQSFVETVGPLVNELEK